MASREQLLAIAEWDAWRYMAKPPRSEAELGISEQEIAAGWAQYLEEREVEARRNRQRACAKTTPSPHPLALRLGSLDARRAARSEHT